MAIPQFEACDLILLLQVDGPLHGLGGGFIFAKEQQSLPVMIRRQRIVLQLGLGFGKSFRGGGSLKIQILP
jgi:hypothetical protein